MREKGRVYGRGEGTSICVGVGVQSLLPLLVVDDVKFASPDEKFYECNSVVDIIVLVSGNNCIFTNAHINDTEDDTYDILIKETPYFITVSTG